MRAFLFAIAVLAAFPASATGFFDYHDGLRENSNLCTDEHTADAREFWEMYDILKRDEDRGRTSDVEVMDYKAYETVLNRNSTQRECQLIYHDDCYSTFCSDL